jgi:hypothetical protein
VPSGQTANITITPNLGYKIASVSGCNGSFTSGGVGSTAASVFKTNAVNANCTLLATFTSSTTTTYTITAVQSTGGKISPTSIIVQAGETATFHAVPDYPGYSLDAITVCGKQVAYSSYVPLVDGSGDGSVTSGPITANCTASATFNPVYTITASASTGGTISPAGAVLVATGGRVRFDVTPNAGYELATTSGTCGPNGAWLGTAISVTTNPVISNCTLMVTFVRK